MVLCRIGSRTYPINYDFTVKEQAVSGGYYDIDLSYQINVGAESRYYRTCYKIVNSSGVENTSDLEIQINSNYQRLRFHSIRVRRNGVERDWSLKQTAEFVQVQDGASSGIYTDWIACNIHLQDIRAGDIVTYDYSIVGRNPVFESAYSAFYYLCSSDSVDQKIVRFVTPESRPLKYRLHNTELIPDIATVGGMTEYLWQMRNLPATETRNYPGWHNAYPSVWLNELDSWDKVGRWAESLFTYTFDERDELASYVDELKSLETNEAINQAIRFVQDDVRYLGLSFGENSHRPYDPAQVYSNRYGDCKDKSQLLVSILRGLGKYAEPVLVSTYYEHTLSDYDPSPLLFDHCITRVRSGDNFIYVDPTITHQGGDFNSTNVPDYQYGLPITEGQNHALVPLKAYRESSIKIEETFDVLVIDGKTNLKAITTYQGAAADHARNRFSEQSVDELEDKYRDFYLAFFDSLTTTGSLEIADNRKLNHITTQERYLLPNPWYLVDSSDMSQIAFATKAYFITQYLTLAPGGDYQGPVHLGHLQNITHRIIFKLPESWTVKNDFVKIENPYFSFSCQTTYLKHDHEIHLNYNLTTKRPFVEASDLDLYRKDCDAVENNVYFELTYDKDVESIGVSVQPVSILMMLLFLIIFGYGGYRLFLHDPPGQNASNGLQYDQLGGWLILVAIGIVITCLANWFSLFSEGYHTYDFKSLILDHNADPTLRRLSVILLVELGFVSALTVFITVLTVMFFMRRTSVPTLMIIMFVVTAVFNVFTYAVLEHFELDSAEVGSEAISSLIRAAIWAPYFHFSKRVEGTFTKRRFAMAPPSEFGSDESE